MSNRLQQALLDMADPARKLADALDEYCNARPMGINLVTGERIEIDNDRTGVLDYQPRTIIDPAHAHLITGASTDRAIMEDLQQRADELLHAIDLARTTITGAIPLQTLELVRGKVRTCWRTWREPSKRICDHGNETHRPGAEVPGRG